MKYVGLLIITIAELFFFNTTHTTTWYVHPDVTLKSIQPGKGNLGAHEFRKRRVT